MNGIFSGGLILAAAFALLFALKVRGAMLSIATAGLLFGGAGYVVQGRPTLAGAPRTATDLAPPLSLADARHAFFGTFPPGERWLTMADSYAQSSDTMGAVQVVQSAIRAHPDDAMLWVGLGNAFVDHSHMLTPAGRFAYFRAVELAPDSPGPRFFLALALLRSGDRNGARAEWQRLFKRGSPTATWRPLVASALALTE